jgi:hypothetical protein
VKSELLKRNKMAKEGEEQEEIENKIKYISLNKRGSVGGENQTSTNST